MAGREGCSIGALFVALWKFEAAKIYEPLEWRHHSCDWGLENQVS